MQKKIIIGVLMLSLMGTFGCTMSKNQKNIAGGGAIGAATGLGIAVISGGALGWGALAGAGVGALAGGIMGYK